MTTIVPSRSLPGDEHGRLERALRDVEAPFACVDLDAFEANADDLVRRAAGMPIRVASKSVRCRALLRAVLERPGFRGVLAYTLPEALWLAEDGFDDLVVAYPTADRGALRALAAPEAEAARAAVAIMVDAVEQLDFIDAVVGRDRLELRVCIDLDAGLWLAGGRVRIGARRSPVHTPEQAVALAREIVARPGLRLVGIMAYEAQIAGVADRPPGQRARGLAIRAMQRLSARELRARRAAAVEAVRAVAPLELVNGGGTGSVHGTAREASVTEVAAGSGLYGPALFDHYTAFGVRPAALFAVPVVRRPGRGVVTVAGGGFPASGAAGTDRLPVPCLPRGLRLDPQEGAGEVQTPLLGAAADRLAIGDRVYFRHAKAGEVCERFDELHLVRGEEVVDVVRTYRGDGRAFG